MTTVKSIIGMKQTWKLDNDTRQAIYEQYVQGVSRNQLATQYGLTWSTISGVIKSYKDGSTKRQAKNNLDLSWVLANVIDLCPESYCYVLGMYLGDGYINEAARKGVFRIRITLDNKHPQIIEECRDELSKLLPDNKVSVTHSSKESSCSDVSCYSRLLPIIFPQHGKGLKCDRDVSLKDWQLNYVKQYPKAFLKGLMKSDGCRYISTSKSKDKIYQRPMYGFTNASKDIAKMFMWCCDTLDIHYTVYIKPRKASHHHDVYSITISKKDDVEFLDEFVDL